MRSHLQLLNYFYITIVILWEPLRKMVITFDASARTIIFLSIVVFLLNYLRNKRFKKLVFSKPFVFWGIWVIFSSINLYVKGYSGELPFAYQIVLKLYEKLMFHELFYD